MDEVDADETNDTQPECDAHDTTSSTGNDDAGNVNDARGSMVKSDRNGAISCEWDHASSNSGTGARMKAPKRQVPNRIPAHLQCSRCSLCKFHHKSIFKCRVEHLHLFAPGWDDVDQRTPWVPPEGFIRWLWTAQLVEGCKVR